MKRKFMLLAIALVLFICCSCQQPDKQSSSDNQPYLSTDTSKSESYNAAITAYNQFLSGTIAAKSNNDSVYINEMQNSSLQPGINRFALFDMNQDGIPELHTQGNTYAIFSFLNNNVIAVYENDAGFDTYLLLKKPALMSIKNSTGITYRYTTIDSLLSATTIEFFDADSDSDDAPYYFNNTAVTKEQFEQLSKEYLELSKEPVTIRWYTYTR